MNAAQFLAATGRPLATGLATQDVNLVLPGEVYGDRINGGHALGEGLRFGSTKTNVGLDVYNLMNSNTPTTYETCTTATNGGASGCSPRRCCCRGSCGSTCRSTSDWVDVEGGLRPAPPCSFRACYRLRMKGIALGLVLMTAVVMSAAQKAAIPRTGDGHPDLQGTWSYATLTTLERPAEFKDKPFLTAAEAAAFEQKTLKIRIVIAATSTLQPGAARTGARTSTERTTRPGGSSDRKSSARGGHRWSSTRPTG
jgi:hypothetical protein